MRKATKTAVPARSSVTEAVKARSGLSQGHIASSTLPESNRTHARGRQAQAHESTPTEETTIPPTSPKPFGQDLGSPWISYCFCLLQGLHYTLSLSMDRGRHRFGHTVFGAPCVVLTGPATAVELAVKPRRSNFQCDLGIQKTCWLPVPAPPSWWLLDGRYIFRIRGGLSTPPLGGEFQSR